MARDIKEEFEMFEKGIFDNSEEDKGIMDYNKYMVILNKGTCYEQICGVYDTEIEALRRFKEEKSKKERNISVIRADVKYKYILGVRFILKYEELE